MFQNHLKLAWRRLLNNRLFSVVQLVGLTAGISACLLIGLFIHHEWTYDAMHAHAGRIVKVNMEYSFGGEVVHTGVTGNKAAPTMAREFPEVEAAVRVMQYTEVVKSGAMLTEEAQFFYADSTFFQIFSFTLLKGDAATALHDPWQVVLSESTARRYFGEADPMGKTLTIDKREAKVTGVMADAPANTHIKPDFVCSFMGLSAARPENETWWNANYATYLLLKNAGGQASMQARLPDYMASKAHETGANDGSSYIKLHLLPLRDLHLRSTVPGDFEPNGDIRYLYILGVAALLILLIGCTTYINLATATGMERAKATGVHKVLGAGSRQLAAQHLGEAAIVTFLALFIAFLTTAPLLPVFNRIFNRTLTAEPLLHPAAWAALAGLGLILSFGAGFYPAVVASRFKPAAVLKGQLGGVQSGAWLRKTLVVAQFSISILLIVCTLLLREQMQFIQNKKLGFDKEQMLVLPADGDVVGQYGALKSQLLQLPQVQSVTMSYGTPANIKGGYDISPTHSQAEARPVTALPADLDFLKTMSIQLVAGSDFNEIDLVTAGRIRSDSTAVLPILLNEAQVAAFGWSPEEAVLKRLYFNGAPAMVKGVVRDFHFRSLHEAVAPLVIFPDGWGQYIFVKLKGDDAAQSIERIEALWTSIAPHRPFSFHFLDEELEQMYQTEMQTTRIIGAFSWLAVALACLGLFALASYHIAQRTKEIGIRKVLGASAAGITALVSKDFVMLVVIALFIASPLAWYLMRGWLQNFAYRIDIQWWVFIVAGVMAVVGATLVVALQTVRAALANPVKSLRSE